MPMTAGQMYGFEDPVAPVVRGTSGMPGTSGPSPIAAPNQPPPAGFHYGLVAGQRVLLPDGPEGPGAQTFPTGFTYPTPPPAAAAGTQTGAAAAAPGAPSFTPGMSRDQVQNAVTQYYASRGVTPNPTSVQYWTDKYFSPEINGDVNYWQGRLQTADEFTGGSGLANTGGIWDSPLLKGWNNPFSPPTAITMENDPGYEARQKAGQHAIESGAAAKGTLLTGGTQKALNMFAQDYASSEYDKVYNRALGEYQQAYNIFNNNQTNQFNRLSSVTGLGANAASAANSAGANFANTIGNLFTGNANNQADAITGAANARASGQVGSANAVTGGLAGFTNTAANSILAGAYRLGQKKVPNSVTLEPEPSVYTYDYGG